MKVLLQEVLNYLERREVEGISNVCSACGHNRGMHKKDSADHDVCIQGLGTNHECRCLKFDWQSTHVAAVRKEDGVFGAERERLILAGKVRDAISGLLPTAETGSSNVIVTDITIPSEWSER